MPTNDRLWQNRGVDPYPTTIRKVANEAGARRPLNDANASGRSAALECGTTVEFSVSVDAETQILADVTYKTNGCGFMISAAEIIASLSRGLRLIELHGSSDLESKVADAIGQIPLSRTHCVQVSADAFRHALADHRSTVIKEFQGETALICTCFGISEESIVEVIERTGALEVSAVSDACKAGSGCGSCRMLIQELIDSRPDESQV